MVFVGLLWLVFSTASAQPIAAKRITKWVLIGYEQNNHPLKSLPKVVLTDTTLLQLELNKQQNNLISQGYLEADPIGVRDQKGSGQRQISQDTIKQYWHIGPQYQWAKLHEGNVPQSWLSEIGFVPTRLVNEPIKPSQIAALQRKLIDHADHLGYPFANIILDSLQPLPNASKLAKLSQHLTLSATLRLVTGPYIRFDTLQLAGNLQVDIGWLEAYLRIKPNTAFNSQRIRYANTALAQLPWMTTSQPIEVRFKNRIAQPTLYANNRASNQVDGVLGLLPNEVDQGKLLVTGELKLQLFNLFRTGKTLILDWQSIKPESQRLNIKYDHPALFRTPFELGLQFSLLKEDITFLNNLLRAQLAYRYPDGSRLGVFVSSTSSQVLLVRPDLTGATALAGSSVVNYGFLYNYQNLDDALYTHKGWLVKAEASIGQKTMRAPSNAIDTWRDSLAAAGLQYSANLRLEHYKPLTNRWVWFNRLNMASVVNNRLVRNELYRIGGLLTLRGFNENYFFSSQYAILTTEMRYYADQATYFSLFLDQGAVTYQTLGQSENDYPTGIGIGTNFTTGTGVFSINYALGRDRFTNFDITTSKIHIGVAARF